MEAHAGKGLGFGEGQACVLIGMILVILLIFDGFIIFLAYAGKYCFPSELSFYLSTTICYSNARYVSVAQRHNQELRSGQFCNYSDAHIHFFWIKVQV